MVVERHYDDAGRLIYLSNEIDDRPIARFEYTHNPSGTVSSIAKSFSRPEQGDIGRYDFAYGYDNLDRLISSSREGSFDYDPLGNQLQNGGQFNELNQLLEDNDYVYTYTTNGNLSTKTSKS